MYLLLTSLTKEGGENKLLISKSLAKDGNMSWRVTTSPTIEPISLSEVKLFSRIDGTDEDDLLTDFIQNVRENTENWLGRALIEQSITLVMDFWPDEPYIELPRPPLISITSYQILAEDDSGTDYDSDNYMIDTISEPGRLIIKDGSTPPYNYDRYYAGHKIIYKAGYGTETTDVPAGIKLGML